MVPGTVGSLSLPLDNKGLLQIEAEALLRWLAHAAQGLLGQGFHLFHLCLHPP